MYFTYKSILDVSDIPYGGEEKNEEILDYSKGIKVRLLKYACTQNLIEDTWRQDENSVIYRNSWMTGSSLIICSDAKIQLI